MNPEPAAAPSSLDLADRLRDLVGDALELPTGEREAFLAGACGKDTGLLAEAMSLVQHGENAGHEFLGQPAHAMMRGEDLGGLEAGSLPPGETLGEYRIVSLLGEGGMGEVYLAEDTRLERRVAIKLLKRRLDDASLARRFRHERKVLAALTHPNIARLYGGGTTEEGRNYLVMEYVEGERLDKFCDAKGLNVGERTALFSKVCAAVSYAHQNLVVHRDLKPANVRVTSEGEPKLLDFGIAKLLDPEGTRARPEPTLTLQGAMTPEYASPEQLKGEPITTASDVYSLGVVLYELLCGQRPFAHLKGRRPDELARAICEEEPPRPSTVAVRTSSTPATTFRPMEPARTTTTITLTPPATLRRQLEGDLDNIVAKALQKEPARRYPSVLALSEDLRRHGEGLPVRARRDTFTYRTGKFVRRNKVGVTAGALAVLALVCGLAATAWQARVAGQERDRAQQERDHTQQERDHARIAQRQAEHLNVFLEHLLGSIDPSRQGKDVKVSEVLDAAGRDLDRELAGEPEVLIRAHQTLFRCYLQMGQYPASEQHARAALALVRNLHGPEDPGTARAENDLGKILSSSYHLDEAEPLLLHALGILRREPVPDDATLARALDAIGFCYGGRGLADQAKPFIDEALVHAKAAWGEESSDYAVFLLNVGNMKAGSYDHAGAIPIFRRVIEIQDRLSGGTRTYPALANLGICLLTLGRYDELVPVLERLERDTRLIYGEKSSFYMRTVVMRGQLYFLTGREQETVPRFQEALPVLLASYPPSNAIIVLNRAILGLALTRTGRPTEGEPLIRAALADGSQINRRTFAPTIGSLETALGECLLAQNRYAEAEPLLLTSLGDLEKRLGPQNRFTLQVRQHLHDLYLAWAKPAEAARYEPVATAQ